MASEIVGSRRPLDEKLAIAAGIIFDVLREQPKSKPLTLGLCGGRSVVGLLSAIRAESRGQPRDIFERLEVFMVDERIVPLSDPQSNFGGLKHLLFDELVREGLLKPQQLHPFEATAETADKACRQYAEELARFGAGFTVVVLGMGEDGHVAGLFPGHSLLRQSNPGFFSFYDSPKPPPMRMTASSPLICASKLSVVLALGEAKRDAWRAFSSKDGSVERCPARMTLTMPRTLVITDLEA